MFLKGMADLKRLGEKLSKLAAGERLGISYDCYGDLFPPGKPDLGAADRCSNYAKKHGCKVEDSGAEATVYFVKAG